MFYYKSSDGKDEKKPVPSCYELSLGGHTLRSRADINKVNMKPEALNPDIVTA